MPVYEYKCKTCGKVFEWRQSINDEPLKKCPESVCECAEKGDGEVSRVFSKNVGLVFKGSGFYVTDYNGKSANGSESNGANSKSGGNSKKTETKTEKAATSENK